MSTEDQIGLYNLSESFLSSLVRASNDAIIGKTVDGIVVSWNEAAERLYGYDADEMIGKGISVLFPPDRPLELANLLARVQSGETVRNFDTERLRKDGTTVAVSITVAPIIDPDGVVLGISTIAHDLTLHNLKIAELREAHRRVDETRVERRHAENFRSFVMNNLAEGLYTVDAQGRLTSMNDAATKMLGWTEEELLGREVRQFVLAGNGDKTIEEGDRKLLSVRGEGCHVRLDDHVYRCKDGSLLSVVISASPLLNGSVVEGAVIVFRDITDEKLERLRSQREASLRETETQLRQLAEHIDLVFCIRQIEPPAYLYISPNCLRLTGRDPAELIAHPELKADLIHPEDRERFQADFMDVVAAGRPAQSEFRIVRPDGEVRWCKNTATAVPNPYGVVERMVQTSEDITDRVRALKVLEKAEATARAASEAKNEFLSRMSHELRTPLNAVLGFSQLLEHRLEGTDHAESARHIVRAGLHLVDLIDEVLDIARIEAGEMSMSAEPILVAEVVDEVMLLMRPLSDAAGVSLVVDGGEANSFVLADRQRLRQIFLNLISNAVKYNRLGGSVWLSWVSEEESLSIAVRDNGIGIAPDLHDRLFKPFDRLGAEGTGVEGTGIGLSVTQGLAELMDGAISVTSAVGQGSTFLVTLPVGEDPRAAVPDELLSNTGASFEADAIPEGTLTALYIEDNEPNVRVMESMFELRHEWHLIHAGLGALGLDMARAHRPNLILLDSHLPDGSGHEVLTALRQHPATTDIRVVVLSADASHWQVDRFLAAGAAQYLTKPLDLDEVLALLDSVRGAEVATA
jgi:PAS domain S-box-containing protein